ncbi:MAG TPA: PilN domain-containing protein [Candidatus Paceibacterota bacterium]
MINLLPEQEKKALRWHYRLRLITVEAMLTTLLIGIGGASLLPALFLSITRREALQNNSALLIQKSAGAKDENFAVLLAETKTKLAVLAAKTENLSLEGVIERVTLAKPKGVQLTGFSVNRSANGFHTLSVEGFAPKRNDLAAFVKTLGAEKDFTSVSFPVSDLAVNEKLTFSLTIMGSF